MKRAIYLTIEEVISVYSEAELHNYLTHRYHIELALQRLREMGIEYKLSVDASGNRIPKIYLETSDTGFVSYTMAGGTFI